MKIIDAFLVKITYNGNREFNYHVFKGGICKMGKKLLSVALAAALTISLFAGCGQAAKESASALSASKEPVTLITRSMFGGMDSNTPVYNELKKSFQEEYSYITLEDSAQKSDEEWKSSVATDFSVGNEPDVLQFFVDAQADAIVETGKFVTVEEIKAVYPDYAKDTTPEAMAAVTNTDGVSRAVPTTGIWEGLYCNKDLFEQYQVELPTDWASLVEAIKVFRENDIIPIACSLSNVPHYWVDYLMLYSSGPELYTSIPETAPAEWVKGLETFKTLRDLGAFPDNTDTVDDSFVQQLFKDKKAAMELDGSWYVNGLIDKENTVVIPFPGVEDQKAEPGAMISIMSSGFYITKKAWNDPLKRDAAVKWVMYNTNKEAVQKYWNGSGIPATEVKPIADMKPLDISAIEYVALSTSVSTPTDSRMDSDAFKIIIASIVKISTGELNAEDVLNEALALHAEKQTAMAAAK